MNNFVVAVISCEKYLNTRVPIVEKYCLKNTPYFIFTGSNSNKHNHIKLECADDYFSLREKTIKLLKWFINTSYDFLIKIDDDTYIDIPELLRLPTCSYAGAFIDFLQLSKDRNYHLEYVHKNCNKKQDVKYFDDITLDFKYAEGGCYILDKLTVKQILSYLDAHTIPEIIQEDITVGYICNKLGTVITDYSIALPWYDCTHFSVHPCSVPLIILLSKCNNAKQRQSLCKRFMGCGNNYYQKYFDLK